MKYILFAVLLFAQAAWATDVYIAQSSQGAGTGADCADAKAVLSASSWAAGTTYHLCTGTWNAYAATSGQALSVSSSGTSGNPIVIVADQGAIIWQSPAFSASGAVNLSGSFITFNGDGNLTIENTANGTGLANNQQSVGLQITGTHTNVTVEGVKFTNICQRAAGDTGDSCVTSGNDSQGVWINHGFTYTNITVTQNTFTQAGHCGIFYEGSSSDSSIVFSQNTISGSNWGICSDNGTGLTIWGNDITCAVAAPCNWYELADVNHHNGIFLFPQSTTMTAMIYDNYIHDVNDNTTGYIFLDPGGTGQMGTVQMFNNVMFTTTGQIGPANQNITIGPPNGAVLEANNTVVGPTSGALSLSATVTAENNIVSTPTGYYLASKTTSGNVAAYNDYFGTSTGWTNNSGGIWTTLGAWTANSTPYCSGGCDATGSITSNPNLTAAFMLNSGSPAIGAGTNLTSLGIAALDVSAPQFFGTSYACGTGCVARPATGAWDMGAYEFTSSGATGGSQFNGVFSGPIGSL